MKAPFTYMYTPSNFLKRTYTQIEFPKQNKINSPTRTLEKRRINCKRKPTNPQNLKSRSREIGNKPKVPIETYPAAA